MQLLHILIQIWNTYTSSELFLQKEKENSEHQAQHTLQTAY